ncbi:urease subunit beta [Pseudomonas vranovensis]|uniref:urease subunit beta n=1 Tax=Pseudomonas vranovensis TaxID=321661 RepID=UPI003D996CD0
MELNAGRAVRLITVSNRGYWPISIGSHFHFFEANDALLFDRALARGHRLDIPAGQLVTFEPGQRREVSLIPYSSNHPVR